MDHVLWRKSQAKRLHQQSSQSSNRDLFGPSAYCCAAGLATYATLLQPCALFCFLQLVTPDTTAKTAALTTRSCSVMR